MADKQTALVKAQLQSFDVVFDDRDDYTKAITVVFSIPSVPFNPPLNDDTKMVISDGNLMFGEAKAIAINSDVATTIKITGYINAKRPYTGAGGLTQKAEIENMLLELKGMINNEETKTHVDSIVAKLSLL